MPPTNQNRQREPDAYLFELSNNVSASTQATNPESETTDVPFAGRVTGITLGWLDGADGQAGVRIVDETGHTYIPYNTTDLDGQDQYIASNDFTRTFRVRFDVAEDETIGADFINTDGTNSHLVNVFLTIERRDD